MNAALTCDSRNEKATGKRSAGNPHAAFEEGGQEIGSYSTGKVCALAQERVPFQ